MALKETDTSREFFKYRKSEGNKCIENRQCGVQHVCIYGWTL